MNFMQNLDGKRWNIGMDISIAKKNLAKDLERVE